VSQRKSAKISSGEGDVSAADQLFEGTELPDESDLFVVLERLVPGSLLRRPRKSPAFLRLMERRVGNALFIVTSVMSYAKLDKAIFDAP
jgi:hypothetical protein